tara:strand:- start:7455 stop:8678 length:1224 start_codon:yes stop_codon:yes gene_type:complete
MTTSAYPTLTQGAFDAMLKELYPAGAPENVAMKRHPFMSMVKKVDDFEGDNLVIPIYYGNPGGRSATFNTARQNTSASYSAKWNLTQMSDYGVIQIDALTIRASRSNRGAFVNARKTEIDMMLKQLGNSAAHALYRNGYGYIGQVSGEPGTDTDLVLTDADDARNFVVGQHIMWTGAADGTSPIDSSNAREVTKVDESTGTITVGAALHTDVADTNYIWPVGDAGLTKITGLAGWIPLTTPGGSDSFFGVNRSVHANRLAGQRLNATGNSIEENILTLAESIVRQGGAPDKCFISHGNFSNLIKGLGTKVEYQGAGGSADVGFGGVQIHTSAGPVMVHPDPDCPANRGYVLQMDTWALHHLDGFPHIDTVDGNSSQRIVDSDGIQIRARYWAQLACIAPAWNGVFAI